MQGSEVDGQVAAPNQRTASDDFDFEAHRRRSVDQYEAVRDVYEECAQAVRSVLKTVLESEGVRTLSIEARVKDVESFGRKAVRPAEDDPEAPRYADPLSDITDLSGARIITFFMADVEKANSLIEREFEVIEKSTMTGLFEEGQRLGYQSVHYLVKFSARRCELPEYKRFKGRVSEIQVRTILQHAWAEIEHDIQYKAQSSIPDSIRRRFLSLAGVVELADREFQAISSEDEKIRKDARRLVAAGKLSEVELTPEALKVYLDAKYGPDARMSKWSYDFAARVCRRLGFRDIGEIDSAVSVYDDDKVSRLLWGSRQGQLQRFEDVLLAAFGEEYLTRGGPAWGGLKRKQLEELAAAGIDVGTYEAAA
jgi:ppGpp synthetase/RelA/SpoT-type nucleotidyltranferase